MIDGKYRLASCENKAAVMQAWFNNKLAEKDLELLMHPDNKIYVQITTSDKSLKMSMCSSMKSEFNMDMEFNWGEEKVLAAPFNCKSVLTKVGDCNLKDVSTYEDGATYTNCSTFGSQGYTSKLTGNSGYIGSVFFERMETSMVGFWVLDSHENMDKVMMEDAGVSASQAADMLKSIALRISEDNGVFTMTDYIGGESKTTSFKLGVECDYNDTTFKMSGSQLVTKTAPGSYTCVYKDKSGKSSVWEACVNDDTMHFKVTKPLNTQTGSIKYKRVADLFGSWKLVSLSNIEAGMKMYGMPQSMIDNLVAERPTHTIKYLGNGRIEWDSGSKVFPVPPTVWKSGEEFSFSSSGYTVNEVIVHTKDGMVGSAKSNGLTSCFSVKVSKNFTIMESMIDGAPHTKSVQIMMRV